MKKTILILLFGLLSNMTFAQNKLSKDTPKTNTYPSLLQLCKELRLLERTSLPSGVPDYRSQTILKIQQTLLQYKARHANIDTIGWSTEQRIDYVLLLAEMNAVDYNCRILKPWVRDPAFYAIIFNEQSDTPEHEGPTSFAAIELWKYSYPLSTEAETQLTAQLKIIPPLYEQAKINLTGNAKDLWNAGIGNVKDQIMMLDELEKKTTNNSTALKNAIAKSKEAILKQKEILPVKNYMEPELRKNIGEFIPEDKRNFFANISFRAPAILYSHSTHWFEIARLREEPHTSLLRKEALPYNMWMQRSEGLATSMEETLMHAGLWDANPRARELVWIMLAQRCARGLASLYAQANMINYEQARKFQVEWTPKGWTGDESLVGFEQHLYLRQPGYGTSYVTGKYFIEKLMMDMGRLQQNNFTFYNFFDTFYNAGIIPVTLVGWQMTGNDGEIKDLLKNYLKFK